ncbi:unnamed protein product [Phytomonas sp. Hart1]|nr:unnamed protein product [Phytomonas sp. Hart1]|eukprot:CCW72105.1 unnamed protein product [Phytomonas sp. isolate Hart1]
MSPTLLIIPHSNKARRNHRSPKKASKKTNISNSNLFSSRSHRSASELASTPTSKHKRSPYMHNIEAAITSNFNRQQIKSQKCAILKRTPTTMPIGGNKVAEMPVEAPTIVIPRLHQVVSEKAEPSRLTKAPDRQRTTEPLFPSSVGAYNGDVKDKPAVVVAAEGPPVKASRGQVQPPPVPRRAQAAAERNKQQTLSKGQNAIPQRPRPQAERAREAALSTAQPRITASMAETGGGPQKNRWLLELNHDATDIENYLCRFREHDWNVLHADAPPPGETEPPQGEEGGDSKHSFVRHMALLSAMEELQLSTTRDTHSKTPPNKPKPAFVPKSNGPNALKEEARRLAQEKREVQREKLKELIREGRAKVSGGKAVNEKKLNVEIKIPQQSGSIDNKPSCPVNSLEAV